MVLMMRMGSIVAVVVCMIMAVVIGMIMDVIMPMGERSPRILVILRSMIMLRAMRMVCVKGRTGGMLYPRLPVTFLPGMPMLLLGQILRTIAPRRIGMDHHIAPLAATAILTH